MLDPWLLDLRLGRPRFLPQIAPKPFKKGFCGLWAENRGAPKTQIQRCDINFPPNSRHEFLEILTNQHLQGGQGQDGNQDQKESKSPQNENTENATQEMAKMRLIGFIQKQALSARVAHLQNQIALKNV